MMKRLRNCVAYLTLAVLAVASVGLVVAAVIALITNVPHSDWLWLGGGLILWGCIHCTFSWANEKWPEDPNHNRSYPGLPDIDPPKR